MFPVHLESQKGRKRSKGSAALIHLEDVRDCEWTDAGTRIPERQILREKRLSCGTGPCNVTGQEQEMAPAVPEQAAWMALAWPLGVAKQRFDLPSGCLT